MNHKSEPSLWEDIILLPAQLSRPPLFSPAEAELSAVVGKNALIPLRLDMPFLVSHMSRGSVPDSLKLIIAASARDAGTASGSGDGGVLKEEMELSSAYIYEYTPGLYGLTPEVLDRCGGVEIKIGQGAKGALGEELPEGLPEEMYRMRGSEPTAFFSTQGRFGEINSPADLRILIDGLREGSGGKPVGVKLAAGRIEEDLDAVAEAEADFVTLDCRFAGSWQPCPELYGCAVPAVYALSRAKRHLAKINSDLDIIISGGISSAADAAKAIAMGATAVSGATAVLNAAALDENRRMTLSPEETRERLDAFFASMKKDFGKICAFTGRSSISTLDMTDIASLNSEISRYCGIRHV